MARVMGNSPEFGRSVSARAASYMWATRTTASRCSTARGTSSANGAPTDGQFDVPQGIAVDPNGNVYVADYGNNRVQKFGAAGGFLGKWGSFGSGDGEFNAPFSVAVDPNGVVYVLDQYVFGSYGLPRIQKFDGNGVFLGSWFSPGHPPGEGWAGAGIAVDQNGNVLLAEYSSYDNRIVRCDSDGLALGSWGSYGTGDAQFLQIAGITVDPSGNVYATDNTLDRVQKFDSSGAFLATWGSSGTGDGEFGLPEGIATDQAGNVYVGDGGNQRVQKFGYGPISVQSI